MNPLYFNMCCCLRGPLSESTDPCPEHGGGELPDSLVMGHTIEKEDLHNLFEVMYKEPRLNRSDIWAKSPLFEDSALYEMGERIREKIKEKETNKDMCDHYDRYFPDNEEKGTTKETFLYMTHFKLTLSNSCFIKGKYFVPYKNGKRLAVSTNKVELHVANMGRNADEIITEGLKDFDLESIDSVNIEYRRNG